MKHIKMPLPLVFIIGAPRSGTTWLHSILSSHPEIASCHAELTVFSNYINHLVKNYEIESLAKKNGKWEVGLPALWNREEFDNRIHWLINEIYSSLNILPKHKFILDKRPEYSFHVELIHHYLPNAKYIHLIRDGREVAYSWNRTSREKGFGNPDFAGACSDWINYKKSARKAQAFPGKNYLEVHYEDLMQDMRNELIRILKFCIIDDSEHLLEQLISLHSGEKSMTSAPDPTVKYEDRKRGKAIWKSRLTKEQQYIAKVILSKDLIQEGYEKDTNWGPNFLLNKFFSLKFKLFYHLGLLK
jgi:hypothetical protein